jgi:adenylosuccinate synthase
VPSFFKELADVEAKGIKDARQRVFVSDRCVSMNILFQLLL